MRGLAINVVLALVWFLLSTNRSVFNLTVGFVLGFLVLWTFGHALGTQDYVRRVFAFFRWLGHFLWAFIESNIQVAVIVAVWKMRDLEPGFLKYPVGHLSETEITILAQTITLTPGTTAVEVDEEAGVLLIHMLDGRNPQDTQADIHDALEEPLLAFMR